MINNTNKITKLRNKLNIMVKNGERPELIYKVSKELDKLIIKYYKELL